MSSYLFSITAQSNTGSDWNWFLIFIIFVVVLAIALIVQASFSKKDAAELEHHEEDAHHAEPAPARMQQLTLKRILNPKGSPNQNLRRPPNLSKWKPPLKLQPNPMISKR